MARGHYAKRRRRHKPQPVSEDELEAIRAEIAREFSGPLDLTASAGRAMDRARKKVLALDLARVASTGS